MRDGASWWSIMTFDFIKPLLECAYSNNERLTLAQMGELPENVQFDKVVPVIEQAWREEHARDPESNKSLVWALLHVFKWRMLARLLLRVGFKAFSMISPLLVFNFTEFIEKEDLGPEDKSRAVLLAIGIILLELLEHFGHAIFDYHMTTVKSTASKSVKVILFRKNFRLSATGPKQFTFAQVLNVINSEADRVFDTIQMVGDILMEPFELAYCAFFIYYYLGWSVLSGLLLWLLKIAVLKIFKARKVEF